MPTPDPEHTGGGAPSPVEAALERATQAHLAGRLDEARQGYGAILAAQPRHVAASHRLGVLSLQQGRYPEAVDCFNHALSADPAYWRSCCSLGQAFSFTGAHAEAVDAFRRALDINEACVDAWRGLGAACRALGRKGEALEAFRRVEGLLPGNPDALNDLGVALLDAGRVGEARQSFARALEGREDFPTAVSNLGNALLADGCAEQALGLLREAVGRWPGHADAWYNLGVAASAMRLFPEAIRAYERALDLAPEAPLALTNLGNLLHASGRSAEALELHQRALHLDPRSVEAANNAAAAAKALGRLDEAIRLLTEARDLLPERAVTFGNLGNLLKDAGRMPEAIASYRRALELDPADTVVHSNLVYSVTFLPGMDAEGILAESLRWSRAHERPEPGEVRHPNGPDPDRPLRIGYVSPDFREHCQALFTVPLFSNHDRSAFAVHCYASVDRPDAITRRLMGLVDAWRDVSALDDAALADLIRADGIDVLVDLTMHMSNGRPLLFARRPAPVQVAWLAYPGTTGLSAMDYRLTDPCLDPPGEQDACYSEVSIRLPDTFWCYDPLSDGPEPGPLPALHQGSLTFGCLNNFCKVSPESLALWAGAMAAVPGSRLLLLAPEGDSRVRILEAMARLGIVVDRIVFASFRPRPEYLALYRSVDICLDTLPYNGHTTSLDAFWMGVPVVTRLGSTVVGRAGWSQLCNLGLADLCAASDAEFIRIVRGLSGDLPRLARLRSELRGLMQASPLMDGPRFARGMEAACRKMWHAWCARQGQ